MFKRPRDQIGSAPAEILGRVEFRELITAPFESGPQSVALSDLRKLDADIRFRCAKRRDDVEPRLYGASKPSGIGARLITGRQTAQRPDPRSDGPEPRAGC